MANVSGFWTNKPKLGRQDVQIMATGVANFTSAFVNGDLITFNNLLLAGEQAIIDSFEVFGTVPDTGATQTMALKAGVTADDAIFLAPLVINQRGQLNLQGTGTAISGGTVIEGGKALILTVTTSPATAVTTGSLFVRLLMRQRN